MIGRAVAVRFGTHRVGTVASSRFGAAGILCCANLVRSCICAGQIVPPAGFELAALLVVDMALTCGKSFSTCSDAR